VWFTLKPINRQIMNTTHSLEALKDIGTLTNDGVCIFDLSSKQFNYFNIVFASLVETSREDLIEKPIEVLEPLVKNDIEHVTKNLHDLETKRKIQNIEFRLKFKSTEKFVAVDAFIPAETNLLVAMIKDVTTIKQHLDYVIEFGARKDALLDMIAHNLSGPLNLTSKYTTVYTGY
jgi:two-component system sensor histidine kinase VicK